MAGARRVVTGIGPDGRSTVVTDDRAGTSVASTVWTAGPAGADVPDAAAAEGGAMPALEPPPGGSNWRIFDLPPDEVVAAWLERQGLDAGGGGGFHTTATVDYVLILDGEVTLELDAGSVDLGPGDCVVQRGTRHAWRNRSGRPVRMAVVMISTER